MMSMRFKPRPLPSPLVGITDEAWTVFVRALDIQSAHMISDSGGFGSYDLRPRRLVELGYATNLRALRAPSGRQIFVCDFVSPLTGRKLLADPFKQQEILGHSARQHHEELVRGEILRPKGVSVAGALAILHRGGRGALNAWPKLFFETQTLYDAAQGAF